MRRSARKPRAKRGRSCRSRSRRSCSRRDGQLIGELGAQLRVSVSIRTLPPYVGQAFIAVEDQRFYKHDGVDVVGMAAAFKDALRGHARGASTITQQLVGNMHPDLIDRADRSIARKIHEQNAAREMERHYDKQQILEAYLNQIHFGHGWYGIEEASRHYFGIPAARLSLAQAATLAALPKGPALYDPIRHADRARDRRNLVLSLMAQQGYVTAAAAAAAKTEPMVTAPNGGMSAAPYVVDVVRREAEANGIAIMDGGYQVTTTIDAQLQTLAADALASGLTRAEARAGYAHPKFATRAAGSSDYLQGAVVAIDPEDGDVLALVGGRSYADSHFDRAINALRQPGSAFKPIVYATALADTLTASSIVFDTALAVPLDRNGVYRPRNDDGQFLGAMTLRDALTRSRNPVAVQLGMAEGMDTITALAHALGITTPISPYPSSAIGASAVRPIEMVAAYAAFDNDGSSVTPRFIHRITDASGRQVYTERGAVRDSVLDPRVAFIVRDMMRDVVSRGTATSVRRVRARPHRGRGEDGDDEQRHRCVVHRDDAGARRGGVGGLRQTGADRARGGGRLTRGADLGRHGGSLLSVARHGRVESPCGIGGRGLRSRQVGAGGQYDAARAPLHGVLPRWHAAGGSVGVVCEWADRVLGGSWARIAVRAAGHTCF